MTSMTTPPRTRKQSLRLALRTDILTPKTILMKHLDEQFKKNENNNNKKNSITPIVLYTCGSLCPVHLQHVALQEMAKEYLEKHYNLKVVGGFLATSNDLYVGQKYKMSGRLESYLNWSQRSELIDLALENHPFLCQDKWDGEEQPRFQEYFMAQKHLQDHLNTWCKEQNYPKIRVLAVHGADLVNKCNINEWFPTEGLGCVCIERPPNKLPSANPDKYFFSMPLPTEYKNRQGDNMSISSTRVQELLRGDVRKEGEVSVQEMLHPKVLEKLCQLWNL